MWKKIVGYTLAAVVAVVGSGFAYLYFREPASRPASTIRVPMTPERIARGKYIFTASDCDGCHSLHDHSNLYEPVVESKRGAGQVMDEAGLPGRIVAPNITPDSDTGLGQWSDGEKLRAIREGIGRDGRALFPMMPYQLFRYMSDEDAESLVAYLNSLAPLRNQLPRSELKFPVSMLIKGEPRPVLQPIATPSRANTIAYGEYLVTVGVCEGCHTPFEKGSFDVSKRLAGGRVFKAGEFEVVSANLTPDPDTGIGNWTLDTFLERFHRHRGVPAEALPPVNKEQWTLMPWRNLAQLSDEDLSAVYAYLRSRAPVTNKVVTHPQAVAQR